MRLFRRSSDLTISEFVRYKTWTVVYALVWCGLVYLTYEVLSAGWIIKVLITVILAIVAPSLGDIFQSYQSYQKENEKFWPAEKKNTEDGDRTTR